MSYTKNDQILNPKSDWNQAHTDEPVFVIRANNWKAAMALAVILVRNNAEETGLIDAVLAMREYHKNSDIPF